MKPALYDSRSHETLGDLASLRAPLSLSLGVALVGLPFFAGGLEVLVRWGLSTDGPAWLVSIGLFLLGVGLTVYSMLPELLRDPDAPPEVQRVTRWVAAASPRAALTLVAVNMPLAAYLGAVHQFRYFSDWALLGIVFGVNALAQAAALGTTPRLRPPMAPSRLVTQPLPCRAAASKDGLCTLCATQVHSENAAPCGRCHTLHHQECWREYAPKAKAGPAAPLASPAGHLPQG